MKKLALVIAAALALAVPASAAKPDLAQLEIGTLAGGSVDYKVLFLGKKNDNPALLWVSQTCKDSNGVPVRSEYHPVLWDALPNGHAEQFSVVGSSCSAAVTKFPDVWTARSNVVDF